jgi:hypothetical protein
MYSDNGSIYGVFTLGGQIYRVVSNEGMNGFLVEIEPESAWPDPLFHPPYIPPTLTDKQEKVRDHWAKQPGTISITTVQVDKAALKSNVVTLTIKGERYRFDGKWTRTEPYPIDEGWTLSAWMGFPIVLRSSSMRPGLTSWDGQGSYGSGNFYFHDKGEVTGGITITRGDDAGHYRLVSAGDITFLVKYDDRKAQRRTMPEEDPIARNARLEAEVAQRAAEEKILRTHKGEGLFEPAKEASLDQQFRFELAFARAGLYPVHVNRLAIDAPVTVFVIDDKEYRFVGNVSINRPDPRLPKPDTGLWAVTDSWDGHTASGDRANINREIWGMSGQINVGGRRFQFGSRGEFGLLEDLNPTLAAERQAEVKRAREKAIREATAHWRPPAVPHVPVETLAGVTKPPSPAARVLPNAQPCEEKTRYLSGLDEAEGYPQPAHLRSYLAELRGTVKAEMRELRC